MKSRFSLERIRNSWRFELSYWSQIFAPLSEEERDQIRSFKDKRKGEAGFLIANGPSLNKVNLDLIKKFPTIGMNRIYLKDFIPTYYVLEDHLVAEDNAEEISRLQGSEMFIPRDLSYCIGGNKKIHYINFVRRYKPFPKFSRDISDRAYWGSTVTFLGLQLAYFLGFKELYVIGLDHSYKAPSSDHTIISDSADPNHFDPRYFGPGKRFHFPDVDRMVESYWLAKKIFEEDGRKIYNATPGTKLEVFKKISFDEIPLFE